MLGGILKFRPAFGNNFIYSVRSDLPGEGQNAALELGGILKFRLAPVNNYLFLVKTIV